MEAKVRKELDTILTMVMNWSNDKIAIAGGEDGWDFLASDLAEEIDDHVCPYIRRMVECKYITNEECGEFLEACYENVNLLAEHLKSAEVQDGDRTAD